MGKTGLVILSLILVATLGAGVFTPTPVKAATSTDTISRGQERGWLLDPGDTLNIYYYADGRSSTVAWKDNWYYWWMNNPFTTINIYYRYPGLNGPWSWVHVDSVAPYYRSLPLQFSKGSYKFVIKNYTKADAVYLKIY